MEWVLVKTVLSLGAVLLCMVGVIFVLKKLVYGNTRHGGTDVGITVLGSRTLQPKRSVTVLRIMDRIIVVGMSEAGMHTLSEFDAEPVEQTPAPAKTKEEQQPAGQPTFIEYLNTQISPLIRNTVTKLAKTPGGMVQGARSLRRAE